MATATKGPLRSGADSCVSTWAGGCAVPSGSDTAQWQVTPLNWRATSADRVLGKLTVQVHVRRGDGVSAPAWKQTKISRMAAIKIRMLLGVQCTSLHEQLGAHSDRLHKLLIFGEKETEGLADESAAEPLGRGRSRVVSPGPWCPWRPVQPGPFPTR
jgi:hypothetical protein